MKVLENVSKFAGSTFAVWVLLFAALSFFSSKIIEIIIPKLPQSPISAKIWGFSSDCLHRL
ncbi:hypothetical protein QFZ31_002232 [Neobacillus niacini]|nr:hypothetical protein [Neobacillus niacini]